MNTVEATEHICNMLEEKKSVTVPEIAYGQNLANVQIYSIMKKLQTAGAIKPEERDNGKIYLLKDGKKLQKYLANLQEIVEKSAKGSKDEKKSNSKIEKSAKKETSAQTGQRDTSKYIYEKQTLPKGKCVLAVVRVHVKQNPNLSLKELQEIFPNEIVGRFGVVNSLSAAKKLSPDRPRYFMKDDQILKASSGKEKVVVTSQWTAERFHKFLEVAKGLGYKIKRA